MAKELSSAKEATDQRCFLGSDEPAASREPNEVELLMLSMDVEMSHITSSNSD